MRAVNLLYVHGTAIGYGRMGVYIASELAKRDITVYDHLTGTEVDSDAILSASERVGHRQRNEGIAETACWLSVPTHARGWWKNQRPVISTMWEASVLPESFRENLHEFERVIVPSRHNVELFSKYHPNVQYAPLGVDPDRWKFVDREVGSTFRFLIGGSGARKGTDLAFKAFHLAFPGDRFDGPTPVLVMKNPKGEDFYGDRIEMVSGRLTDQEEVDLYASCHAYLQPSRGEGFGLQPLQAIAQGMPTILTDAHGHESFAHLGIGLSSKMVPAAYFIYGDAGDWWEPDLDELVDQMRWVYDHYDEAKNRAVGASDAARNEFSWSAACDKFIDALGGIDSLRPLPNPGGWYKPTSRRYLVVTNQPWTADIAGATYQFEPGRWYYEPADVKRILMDAGLLDPVCIRPNGDEDLGLAPSQLAKIDGYSAAHSYCHACHQKLGSGVTKADELMAAR